MLEGPPTFLPPSSPWPPSKSQPGSLGSAPHPAVTLAATSLGLCEFHRDTDPRLTAIPLSPPPASRVPHWHWHPQGDQVTVGSPSWPGPVTSSPYGSPQLPCAPLGKDREGDSASPRSARPPPSRLLSTGASVSPPTRQVTSVMALHPPPVGYPSVYKCRTMVA